MTMTENNKVAKSSEQRPWWKLSLSSWAIALSWGLGAFIFGWLLAGIWYNRDYWNLAGDNLGWADWSLAGIAGSFFFVMSLFLSFVWKKRNKSISYLPRIFIYTLPVVFLVVALAALILTLTTYDYAWRGSRQGILTAFGALIAAVGVIMTVSINYRMGEENRLAQQWNLETQLSHQKALEDEKGEREQQRQDVEVIKNLNDRLHNIIERRYSKNPQERSASYFQLAALYRDWEVLSGFSTTIDRQRDSQQRNILKILFGVHQESLPEGQKRVQIEIQALNSVIQSIFPSRFDIKPGEKVPTYDLSFLDLHSLDFSNRFFGKNSSFKGAYMEKVVLKGSILQYCNLNESNLDHANMAGVDLGYSHVQGSRLYHAKLNGADMRNGWFGNSLFADAVLTNASLDGADMLGANLRNAYFDVGSLCSTRFIDEVAYHDLSKKISPNDFNYVVNQLSSVKSLPELSVLLKAWRFNEGIAEAVVEDFGEDK